MDLLVYKKFTDRVDCMALAELLTEQNVPFQISEEGDTLDVLYGDKQFRKQYSLLINGEHFRIVDHLLERQAMDQLTNVQRDHYLFGFDNEELYDILSKPDEWTPFDVLLARNILGERGQSIDDKKVLHLKEERIKELAKPDDGHTGWIYVGYVLALLGGLLGVFIGWHLSTYKKTLPDGQRIPAYRVRDRAHGNRILFIGITVFVTLLIAKVINTDY